MAGDSSSNSGALAAGVLPTVRFQSNSLVDVSEGAGSLGFTLLLSEASSQPVTIVVEPASYRSADFNAAPLTLTFQPGQTSVSGSVAIYDDALDEPDEVYSLTITSATNASIDLSGTLTNQMLGYIKDNDVPVGPTVRFQSNSLVDVSEGAGSLGFTLLLSEASSQPVTVVVEPASYRAADFNAAPLTLTFQPGQTSASGSVAIYDDALDEPDEVYSLTITSATNASVDLSGTLTNQMLGYIKDNDVPVGPIVRFQSNTTVDVSEGAGSLGFTLLLSEASSQPVTVVVEPASYRAADFNAAPLTLTFQPGQTSVLGSVAIYDDALDEPDEVYSLTISSVTNASVDMSGTLTNQMLGYIKDNDASGAITPDVTVVAPSSVREGDGAFGISLVFTDVGVLSGSYSYGFAAGFSTATNGVDVSVPSGAGSFSVVQTPRGSYAVDLGAISIFDDTLSEGAETFAISITVPGHTFANGANTTVQVITLRDNDPITGDSGANTLTGGADSEVLNGQGGDDILAGGAGDDSLDGGAGQDQLFGQAGADILRDGGETTNRDFLYGGSGDDTYFVTSSLTGPLDLVYEGGANPDLAAGASDVDTIRSAGEFFWDYYGVGERLYIDRVAGSQLVGGTNDQQLFGGAGSDQIIGYGGTNRVDAGAGTDAISFGLYGLDESHDGVNTLVMKPSNGLDYVYEFESGVDKIDLTAFNFGITGAQVLAQAVNVDNPGTADDYCYFYLTSAGGVDNYVAFIGLLSNQLQAGDFIT